MRCFNTFAELLLLAGSAFALVNLEMRPRKIELQHAKFSADSPTRGYGYFDQLIDHDHPERGTFKQRYAWNSEFYEKPGSPIVMMGPNESALEGFEAYTTNVTLTGVMAQEVGAGAVVIEHRFWGESSPFQNLTVKNLQYLTVEQSVKDIVYFAKHVALPFDLNRTSSPDKAPWVLSGCSYSGALTAWVDYISPGTFWAYSCSSPTVEAIGEYWEYYEQIKMSMPKNCSSDYARIIEHVDEVLLGHNEKAKQELKAMFGLADLKHDDDFAAALSTGLYSGQSVLFSDPVNPLLMMCDFVENVWPGSAAPVPGARGVGLAKALAGFSKWYTSISLPGACAAYGYWTDPNDTSCYDSHNATSPLYTDLSVENAANRQWFWFICNEPLKWWQVRGEGNLISRLVDEAYFEDQCALFFPREGKDTYGIAKGANTHHVNIFTGGWNNLHTHRLQSTAGEFDAWRPTTVVSEIRPGGPLRSTPQHPTFVVPQAAHCGDMSVDNRNANDGVRKVFDAEVANVKKWVQEFYDEKGGDDHCWIKSMMSTGEKIMRNWREL